MLGIYGGDGGYCVIKLYGQGFVTPSYISLEDVCFWKPYKSDDVISNKCLYVPGKYVSARGISHGDVYHSKMYTTGRCISQELDL